MPPQHPPLSFGPVAPELVLVGFGIALLLIGAMVPRVQQSTLALGSLAGIAGAAAATVLLWNWNGPDTVLGGAVAADRFAVVTRLILLVVGALVVFLGY